MTTRANWFYRILITFDATFHSDISARARGVKGPREIPFEIARGNAIFGLFAQYFPSRIVEQISFQRSHEFLICSSGIASNEKRVRSCTHIHTHACILRTHRQRHARIGYARCTLAPWILFPMKTFVDLIVIYLFYQQKINHTCREIANEKKLSFEKDPEEIK